MLNSDQNHQKKIIFYDDSLVYGGHEIMAAYAIEAFALCKDFKTICIANKNNNKLLTRLNEISKKSENLEIFETDIVTKKMQGVRNWLSNEKILNLSRIFKQRNPDVIVIIQGDIELSSIGLLAARKAKITSISYIPVPHTLSHMRAKAGFIRDKLNSYLFQVPDAFITISESMRKLLKQRGTKRPISIVYNGIDIDKFQSFNKSDIKQKLGLPLDKKIIGTVGRIEFKQKRQDLLLQALHKNSGHFENTHTIIIGDGPDKSHLENLICELNLSKKVSIHPWVDNPSELYSAMDFLIIPSQYEGVPLVMIEALFCGVPVLASDRDGMQDILPASWRFQPESQNDLAAVYKKNKDADNSDQIQTLQTKIKNEMNLTIFGENFISEVTHLMSNSR